MSDSSLLDTSENSADVDVSVVKVVGFVFVMLIASAGAGYFIATVNVLYTLISLAAFWVLFTLQIFFIKGMGRVLGALFLECLAITLPSVILFETGASFYILVAFGLLFLLLLLAENSGRHELRNSLKIPFFRTARHSLSKSIPAVLAFMAIVYVFVAGREVVAKNGEIVSEAVIAPVVGSFVPGVSSKTSLRDLIEKIAELRLGKEAYSKLPAYIKEESVRQTETFIEKYAGSININAPLGESIYKFFSERLKGADFLVKIYIGVALLTIMWFVIKTTTWVLYLPLAGLAFLLYEILMVTNFATLQYESRSKEIILLK